MLTKDLEITGLGQDSEIIVMAGTPDGRSQEVARRRGVAMGGGAPISIPIQGQLAPGNYDLMVLQIDWAPSTPMVDYKLRAEGGRDQPFPLSNTGSSYPSTSIGTQPISV